MKPTHIVIHHTVTPHNQPLTDAAASINRSHKGRGFPRSSLGFYIGYHYLIAKNGDYGQYRHQDEIGSHCSAKNMNSKSIGVSLIGNFEINKLEGKQLESLVKVLKMLVETHKIPRENLGYHRMYGPTACPGKDVINQFNQILDMVYDGLDPWEKAAIKWGKDTEVVVSPENSPFTLKQTAWLLEVLRKTTVYIVKLLRK